MEDLIKALKIFLKYEKSKYPTWCEHDVLHVTIDDEKVGDSDKAELEELGFIVDEDNGGFISFRFGSS